MADFEVATVDEVEVAQAPTGADSHAGGRSGAARERKPRRQEEDFSGPPPERPEKVPQPNEENFKKEEAEYDAKLQKIRERIDAIRAKLGKRDDARGGHKEERDAARKKFQEAQAATNAKNVERQAVKAQIEQLDKARDYKIEESKKMRTTLKFTAMDQLDKKIAEFEARMSTESLSLSEEKKLLAEKQQYQAQKSSVREYANKQTEIDTIKQQTGKLRDEFKKLGDQWGQLRDVEKKLRAEMQAVIEKQQADVKIPDGLLDEFNALKKQRTELKEQLKAFRDDYYAKRKVWQEYDRKMRLFNKYKKHQEWLVRQEERAKFVEARKEEEQGDPVGAKVELCATLIAYLERLRGSTDDAQTADSAAAAPLPKGDKPGAYLQKKGGANDQMALLSGGASLAKGGKQQRRPARPEAKEKESIKHSVTLFGQFDELHVRAPVLYSEVPAAITALKERREALKVEQAAKAEAAKQRAAERAAAEAAKAASQPADGQPDAPAADSATGDDNAAEE